MDGSVTESRDDLFVPPTSDDEDDEPPMKRPPGRQRKVLQPASRAVAPQAEPGTAVPQVIIDVDASNNQVQVPNRRVAVRFVQNEEDMEEQKRKRMMHAMWYVVLVSNADYANISQLPVCNTDPCD